VRSILSWEACEHTAKELDMANLHKLLVNRESAKAEDMMMDAVSDAIRYFRSIND
jgi:xylose isomerase